jgi:hypothetical protein
VFSKRGSLLIEGMGGIDEIPSVLRALLLFFLKLS